MKQRASSIVFLAISLFISGCAKERVFKEIRFLMSTYAEISVVSESKTRAYEAMDLAFSRMKEIEKLASRFDKESQLYKINAAVKDKPLKISEEIIYLLKKSEEYSEVTQGAFDITVLPLLELWKEVEEKNRFPSSEGIRNILDCIGYSNLVLNEKELTLEFKNPQTKIDLGGIAKGYAVDEAIKVLKEQGIKNALVNLGGNMYCLGENPRRKFWRLGLQHPEAKDKFIATLALKDMAISTSANYERNFSIQGKTFGHIINPQTGMPVEGLLLSVTVVSKSALSADALSTGLFVLGKEKDRELLRGLEDIEIVLISKKQDADVLDIWVSEGLKDKIKFSEGRYARLWN